MSQVQVKIIYPDNSELELSTDIAEKITKILNEPRKSFKECTSRGDFRAVEILNLIEKYTPSVDKINKRDWTGYYAYILDINGVKYQVKAVVDYINTCYDNKSITGFIAKGKKYSVKKIR